VQDTEKEMTSVGYRSKWEMEGEQKHALNLKQKCRPICLENKSYVYAEKKAGCLGRISESDTLGQKEEKKTSDSRVFKGA